jgi:hypothetical protein
MQYLKCLWNEKREVPKRTGSGVSIVNSTARISCRFLMLLGALQAPIDVFTQQAPEVPTVR